MERWDTKKRRKQEGQSLIAAWIEPVRAALSQKKQPQIWDFAEEVSAQRGQAGTEWWANQTDPAIVMNLQAGQALANAGEWLWERKDAKAPTGRTWLEELTTSMDPTVAMNLQTGQALADFAGKLEPFLFDESRVGQLVNTKNPQQKVYEKAAQVLGAEEEEGVLQKRRFQPETETWNDPFGIAPDDPRWFSRWKVQDKLNAYYDAPVPSYDPDDPRDYEVRESEWKQHLNALQEQYSELSDSVQDDKQAAMEAFLGPEGMEAVQRQRREILEPFRGSANYEILCKDYDDITPEEYGRLSLDEVHALNQVQAVLRNQAEDTLAEYLSLEQILATDFTSDGEWKAIAQEKAQNLWQQTRRSTQQELEEMLDQPGMRREMNKTMSGLMPGTEAYERELREFILNHFSPDSELYTAALLYRLTEAKTGTDLDAAVLGFDHTLASLPESSIYLGSEFLGSGQEAQRVEDNWAISDMAAQQSPLGYGSGALLGNGILYAFPGRLAEWGAQRVLYPLAGIPGGAFFTSLMGQSASDLLIGSSETIARGVQQGMSADEIGWTLLEQQGGNLVQNLAMKGLEDLLRYRYPGQALDIEYNLPDNGNKLLYEPPKSATWDSPETLQSLNRINGYLQGGDSFENVLDDYAQIYAVNVHSNKKWSWEKNVPGGQATKGKRQQIKARAVELGLIPDVQVQQQPGMKFGVADFRSAGLVRMTVELPEDMWKLSNAEQFKWLDAQIENRPAGYVWHHSEIPGRMELVPYGVHNIVAHNGGRSPGMWAYIPK